MVVSYCSSVRTLFLIKVFSVPSHQNDVSDIPDLTFSMDPDEEKHILYEKNEVYRRLAFVYHIVQLL